MNRKNRRLTFTILIFLTLIFSAELLTGQESPYIFTVRFSDTAKFNNLNLEQNIIDTFEFEGTLHWTEFTELYGRLKLDNWSDSVGGMLFGSITDQRYGMNHQMILDKSYISSRILDEAGVDSPIDLLILGGVNAGGVLNEEWTAFNFENYRLGGIYGAVVQTDIGIYKDLYMTGAFNPAFGIDDLTWRGVNGAASEHPDILTGLSWRSDKWWTELYWDSYANSDAAGRGSDLSILGSGFYWHSETKSGMEIRFLERLEYGIPLGSSGEDHLRYGTAFGVDHPFLYGLKSNLSFNGFFLDRQDMNLGWDCEMLFTESMGLILAVGGISLNDDPSLVYEVGLSGRYSFLSLFFGYSDHQGGNDGWFSGAFDTTPDSEEGIFLRLDVEY